MKTMLKTLQESQTQAKTLSACRCTKFLIGWTKRFGSALNLFVFPSNNKEHVKPLRPTTQPKKGETKMPTAYILVNTEIGSEKHVLKALKKIDGVEEVHNLLGVYDIIVNIKANSMDELKQHNN